MDKTMIGRRSLDQAKLADVVAEACGDTPDQPRSRLEELEAAVRRAHNAQSWSECRRVLADVRASASSGVDSGRGSTGAKPFSVGALAEVATKAVYTHGFGFRGVVGPYERDGRWSVNFCWDDNTLVRATFWMAPDEAPEGGS